jgi:hypothetical protein
MPEAFSPAELFRLALFPLGFAASSFGPLDLDKMASSRITYAPLQSRYEQAHPSLKDLRRRFAAVAHDIKLDTLAFIQSGNPAAPWTGGVGRERHNKPQGGSVIHYRKNPRSSVWLPTHRRSRYARFRDVALRVSAPIWCVRERDLRRRGGMTRIVFDYLPLPVFASSQVKSNRRFSSASRLVKMLKT